VGVINTVTVLSRKNIPDFFCVVVVLVTKHEVVCLCVFLTGGWLSCRLFVLFATCESKDPRRKPRVSQTFFFVLGLQKSFLRIAIRFDSLFSLPPT